MIQKLHFGDLEAITPRIETDEDLELFELLDDDSDLEDEDDILVDEEDSQQPYLRPSINNPPSATQQVGRNLRDDARRDSSSQDNYNDLDDGDNLDTLEELDDDDTWNEKDSQNARQDHDEDEILASDDELPVTPLGGPQLWEIKARAPDDSLDDLVDSQMIGTAIQRYSYEGYPDSHRSHGDNYSPPEFIYPKLSVISRMDETQELDPGLEIMLAADRGMYYQEAMDDGEDNPILELDLDDLGLDDEDWEEEKSQKNGIWPNAPLIPSGSQD